MYKLFYLFLFTSLIYSNDDTHTLTEFEIVTINSFRDSGFSGISDDYTVINNLIKSNFYSTDSEIHFGMYEICLGNDELGCANLHLNRAIQIDSKQRYYDLSDSLTLYREFLENARRAVSKENYDIAIEDYENIIERFSGKGLPYYELGLIFDKLNDRNSAIINFNQAISFNPNKDLYQEAIYSIAQSISREADEEARRQDYNSAIPKYLEAISNYPNFTQAYFQLAKSFYSLGDYEEAKLYLLQCLDINPNQPQPLMMLATIYMRMKDFANAENYYRKAINVDPQSYKAYFRLGTLLMQEGEASQGLYEAKIFLEKSIALKSDYYNAYENLGIVNKYLKNYDNAIENFLITIDILGDKSKKRYKSLYLLADIYNTKKEYKTAKDYALVAVDIKENGGSANFHLGIACKNLDERSRAKDAFKRATKDKDWRASAKYELNLMEMGK